METIPLVGRFDWVFVYCVGISEQGLTTTYLIRKLKVCLGGSIASRGFPGN